MKDQVTERALKIAKERHGWNQVEFATEIGVDKQHVTNWLKRGMPGSRYAGVAKKLGVKVEQLLSDEPAETLDNVIAAAKIDEPSIAAYNVKVTPEAMLVAAEWAKLPTALRAQVSALVHMMVAELARSGGPDPGAKGPKSQAKSSGRRSERPNA